MLNKFRINIGLEIHAQLASRTKLFSPAPVLDDAPPNTAVNIFDCAIPGTMPVLNKECVMMALKAGKILNCEIPKYSRFDRKHYFYPDMPMGFQITQNEMPIAKNGYFDYYPYSSIYSTQEESQNNTKSLNKENDYFKKSRVMIKQVQLEIDSGKTIVDLKKQCLIDLNRAGVGLIEIITLPTLSSSLEAVSFLEQLRIFLIHNNISKGEMHKGHYRVDANISLIEKDAPIDVLGERTEVKNINSFKDIVKAIDFEILRHANILNKGERINYETRKVCEDGTTVPLRDKEGEIIDYRFTVEPNLPLLKIEEGLLNNLLINYEDIPHLIYINKYGMNPKEALKFTTNQKSKHFMDIALPLNNTPLSNFLNWYKELKFICDKIKKEYPLINVTDIKTFCFVVNLENENKITKLTAIDLLKKCLLQVKIDEEEIIKIIKSNNLWRINSEEEINYHIEKVCKKEKKLYEQLKSERKSKHFNKLRNMIFNECNKTIQLEDLEKFLRRKLDS
ncbi:Glutamyl-tRNA(Gln) amidotransferase subunit B, mitochondrial [Strongyloides ratti]|uniref:Glutamyl-tRNA(Gln) amidotransferase subunit B, mitochondrial n=1 Tax=Strongyloides ratti TaxID=34506 RepID=A0A090L8I0_STRRB|nr:Glutamyl-tRNA(Gln) amidotransferase subunit B, mitochondrial [Strongyloides ratti]CEF63780.1 Glutamyl-tRNA(Gln) amidotransferase subunit B, mitochondrial [Strongyloides ratti]